MIIIAHRGNTAGIFESYENEPNYIDMAIKKGYDVEIDLWDIDGQLYLGHDSPQYGIDFRWLRDRLGKLWIHCKNLESAYTLSKCDYSFNYFWHQTDDFVLTAFDFFWTYPGKMLTDNSIAVLPETVDDWNINNAFGICTDFADNYAKIYKIQ